MTRLTEATAISIRQPWSWCIMQPPGRPFKNVENRSWPTSYRGPLVIHAGAADFYEADVDWIRRTLGMACPYELDCGSLLGVVDLVDCIEANSRAGREMRRKSRWAGRPSRVGYYFVLARPRLLDKPIAWKGSLGLFKIRDAKVLARLRGLM